jgi:hypothetical protein
MTTETLTGRELDAAVAKVLGWRWVMPQTTPGRAYLHPPEKAADWLPAFVSEVPPEGKQLCDNAMPAYSAPDCSGLAPVLAWLEANRPTRDQAKGMLCIEVTQVNLVLANDGSRWYAQYLATPADFENETLVLLEDVHEILPEAGCRLVLAWAKRRAET